MQLYTVSIIHVAAYLLQLFMTLVTAMWHFMLVIQSRVLHADDYLVEGQAYDVINCSSERHCIMGNILELTNSTQSKAPFML